MLTAILVILYLAIIATLFATGKISVVDITRDNYQNKTYYPRVKTIVALVVSFIIVVGQPFKIERIDAGTIGLKENLVGGKGGFSKIDIVSGFTFYNSWTTSILEIPIDNKQLDFPIYEFNVKGGNTLQGKPTLILSPRAETIIELYMKNRTTYKSSGIKGVMVMLGKTATMNSINDVLNVMSVDSVFRATENFRLATKVSIEKTLGKYFNIIDYRPNMISPDYLKEAIIEKATLTQAIENAKTRGLAVEENGKADVKKAEYALKVDKLNAEANTVKSQPKLLELYKAETDREWAVKGISPWGTNNVFGTMPGMFLNRK